MLNDFNSNISMLQGSMAQQTKEELSLDTLNEDEISKIMAAYKRCRDQAKMYYEDTIQPAIIKRQELYDAPQHHYKQKFPVLSEDSNWISRDVKTTIDTMLPSMVEVFTGSEDPCDIKGVNLNDDESAKKLQSVIAYQIQKKNKWFVFLTNFMREGLITNLGVAKVYWNRKEELTEMKVLLDETNMMEYMQKAMLGEIIPKQLTVIEGASAAELIYDEVDLQDNAPVLENMSPSELRFTPDGRTLQECKFVAQRKIVKGDYLKRKEQEGIYQDVDRAIQSAGNNDWTDLDKRNNKGLEQLGQSLNDGDNASKDVELYEAYLSVDYNGDGILEKVIVHAVDDVPIAIQENAYQSPPIFIFAPEIDPYTPFGESSMSDTLEQLQDLKTALVRQMIIAISKNNRPQKLVRSDGVDMDSLINGDEVVAVDGRSDPKDSIFVPPQIPIDNNAMTLVQYAQNEIESQSGSTRYNQGLDSNSLNKTATGITALMGQADKRIRLIARTFAETAWIPIIKHIILLNQQFLEPSQQFRLNDEMVSLSPDEINIDYDLVVNTGQGAGTKEAQMNYLISLLSSLYPVLQQLGIATADTYYKTACDLLELMGIRSAKSYLLDPNSEQYKLNQQQAQQQAQAQQQQAMKLEEAKLQAKTAPKMSVNYKDLPLDAQEQALEKYGGMQTTPQALIDKQNVELQNGWWS